MDLDVSFDGKTTCTLMYIKMDAKESLLLSEGVCKQLGIVTYHSQVVRRKGKDQGRCAGRKESASSESQTGGISAPSPITEYDGCS